MENPVVAYEYKDALYLNITNRCPTSCLFCIKRKWEMKYRGNNLNLAGKEPSFEEIISQIEKKAENKKYPEIVFCGYGEPTERFEILKKITAAAKSGNIKGVTKNVKIRINTNGLGNLINGYDITAEMKGIIDSVHISLNSHNKENWIKFMRPAPKYEKEGFESVLDFISKAKKNIPEVFITAIENLEPDKEGLKKLSERLGVRLRLRPELENEN
ncbi:MAG: radical SAM protein [Elusimicrobia bacterium]|nr:radical SAM protein [Elusimicrobiota bacterium]